jgi:transaldolase
VTLIFDLARYRGVMEAYVAGLEDAVAAGATDLSRTSSVASFFISRVDTEVDRRLDADGSPEALALRGTAAVAQGQLAFAAAAEVFSGPRWAALASLGARPQRPLWASTSTKNPDYPDTLYVDTLIGPGTVNTLPDNTLEAFDDHGTVARTVDADPEGAARTWHLLGELVDLDEVGRVLEAEGVTAFEKSFDELLGVLERRVAQM